MRKIWNNLREVEWFAVLAMVLLTAALILAVLIAVSALPLTLWVLAIVLTQTAIVSAIFSHRT